MKIGIVDLDTSHPEGWIPIERELGHEVAGVWDGGSIHPFEYVQDFSRRFDIPRVFESLEQMAGEVDCAIIHGCDWDTHIDKARVFVEKGKAVLFDKPLAGNMPDLKQLCQWVDGGARITGGSALCFCYEIKQWLGQPIKERGKAHTVISGCAVDEFNYGIHAYSALSGVFGAGIASVRCLGSEPQHRIEICWKDGRVGIVIMGDTGNWLPFHLTVVTEKVVHQFQPTPGDLYRALLESTLPYLAGETDTPPVPMNELIEPELAAIAALVSMQQGGRSVKLDKLDECEIGYNGPVFAEEYRKSKYPTE